MNILKPHQSVKKALRKIKIHQAEFDDFKKNLKQMLERLNPVESEEYHKNLMSEFLKETFYQAEYYINTKGRLDLVIHAGKTNKTSAAILFEVKKPGNSNEMIRAGRPNAKALQELLLYYLRESVSQSNKEVRHLIATDLNGWFIFDATVFEKLFVSDKKLVRQFEQFDAGQLAGNTTDWFYDQIASKAIDAVVDKLECTHFDLRDYTSFLNPGYTGSQSKLITLFKLLSPPTLLKLPFANDSNTLNKPFYSELLHLIGLTEIKDSGKKLIQRKAPVDQDQASLLENTINQIKSMSKLDDLKNPAEYGDTEEERSFNVALELVITWMNRILFLKLLEAQLLSWHRGDAQYNFLNQGRIKDFDELKVLFFEVLALKTSDRSPSTLQSFPNIPYLNSSLFELSPLEHQIFTISSLRDNLELPLYSGSVLKKSPKFKSATKLSALEYLFEFLNAYDFASEAGGEEIQAENKSLINASVLGLIFEKINGYKDGSFFTPGFITMYMARESLRRAVVDKFNATNGWQCQSLTEVYNQIGDKAAANTMINSLRICDPAVGSGHFLVSALNELIAIKQELGILLDDTGKALRDYDISVENDDLVITNDEGELFEYRPRNGESLRIQRTLFREKQTIIEQCLFGVDINPNATKICRLRLWIELLKNAYYKDAALTELETLPNIDINIKEGNSLVSRFALDADLKQALKKSNHTVGEYQLAIQTYHNTTDRNARKQLLDLIDKIKRDFRSEIQADDPLMKKKLKLETEFAFKYGPQQMFNQVVTAAQKKDMTRLAEEIEKLESEVQAIQSNKIYENAFEWRFEFPEVLDVDGNFVGFDMVIGNPPYKMIQPHNTEMAELEVIKKNFMFTDFKIDLFHLFFQQGLSLARNDGYLFYIAPSSLLNNVYAKKLRDWIGEENSILFIGVTKEAIFEDADVHNGLYFFQRAVSNKSEPHQITLTTELRKLIDGIDNTRTIAQNEFTSKKQDVWNMLIDNSNIDLINKFKRNKRLGTIVQLNRGLITGDRDKYFSKIPLDKRYKPILSGSDINRYFIKQPTEYVLFERPKTAGGCWDENIHFAEFKVCIRQIGDRPTATLISEKYAVTGNVFTLTNNNIGYLKYILGILNSSAVRFFWSISFADFKKSFPQVSIHSLEQIPIPEASKTQRAEIETTVDQILTARRADPSADTSDLVAQIDQIVYELYGLTTDEIKVVEGN